jgi:hypothetical protein
MTRGLEHQCPGQPEPLGFGDDHFRAMTRGRSRRWVVVAGLGLLIACTAGCQVDTKIDVNTTPKGTGTVQVAVTLDEAATRTVGDIKSELQTADMTAAGWRVSGPFPGAGGSSVIRATHGFTSLQQASTLVAEIAGTGPAGSRPFQLHVTRHKTFWSTSTRLTGRADLRCDLACFGDSGLRRELGATTGVDPGTVASQKQDFTFDMTVTLPGDLKSTNARTVAGHRLIWNAPLGRDTVLSETTSERNMAHVAGAVILASAAPLVVVAGVVTVLWRRSRRRRSGSGREAT